MEAQIEAIEQKAFAAIANASDEGALDEVRVAFLGKKGEITELFKQLGKLSKEERPLIGQKINEMRDRVTDAFKKKVHEEAERAFLAKIEKERIDVTLPGRVPRVGKLHVLTQVEEEIISVLQGMGFIPFEGPELEDEYHNFEALNIPYYHPARDDHDSVYVSKERLLKTHTSPAQIRVMEKVAPPIAVVSPGKCARRDAVDATHSPVFNQVEGFFVDENVTFGDMKGCLLTFCRRMFGDESEIRLRPDFFPFVEPGAEIGVSCMECGGKGCRVCKNTGWIEILGAGMIHPRVLEAVGYDSGKYSGFAFGMGIERVAMKKYGIPDIRLFYENDEEFLRQF